MRAASKSRGVGKILAQAALCFGACNLLAADLAAQCPSPVAPIPDQTVTSGAASASSNSSLKATNYTVSGSGSVTFVSGQCIELAPNFHATAGTAATTFHAWVGALPTVSPASPQNGVGNSGQITWTASSPSGYGYLTTLLGDIGTSFSSANSCFIVFNAYSNVLWLADNSGNFPTANSMVVPSASAIGNSQCIIYGGGSSVSRAGNQLALTMSVTFQPAYAGLRNQYLFADDQAGLSSDVQQVGTWTVPAAQQYSLTTAVSPSAGGSISPSCPSGCLYTSGSLVTITPTPAAGYQFSGFTGSVNSSSNPITVTMNSSMAVTANFTQTVTSYSLTTSVSPSGSGTLTFSPPCCTYNAGTQVSITASAASGYQFNGWTGVDSSSGTTGYVTMNGNRSITANFTTVVTQYQLTTGASPSGAGSVSPSCPSGCSVSSPVAITALPNAGYAFTNFSGSQSSNSNPASFTMTTAITETANFTAQTPAVSGMSPSWGPANTPVTISGAGWGSTAGTSTVKFNGVTAALSSWSATAIVAQVPSGATSGAITVNVAGFTPAASPSSFTVSDSPPPAPSITSLSLSQGPPQVGFVINLSNFTAAQVQTATVTLNGTPVRVTARADDGSSITVQVVNAQTGGDIPLGGPWAVAVDPNDGTGQVLSPQQFKVVSSFGCNF